ncbi:glutathione S-transferase zeta class isoform X4 [Ricinus communis]|uniref:glutathione S-transferase zeta class isoform X4 n=1 Tax=Ricinus communis TaxID=3988 RepID=UPI000772292E|nr:glutathione S-transferase zeta class isoform X4 [Ricinus communis]|eukprot:XP_015584575.1 glutathione S-transferase zeta class isoform X2 [Ricinus communis]
MEDSSQITNSSSPKLVLYSFWQSSCAWRIRFALNLKVFGRKVSSKGIIARRSSAKSSEYAVDDQYLISQAASIVSSSIQPLHMVSVLKVVEEKVGPEEPLLWAQSSIEKGFAALEKLLKDVASRYATGEAVYMADVFLAPQIAVAMMRFKLDMSKFPTLGRIYESCKALPEFIAALPQSQPDAVH